MAVDLSVAIANLKFQSVDLLTNKGKSTSTGAVDKTGASFMDIMNAVGGSSAATGSGTSSLFDVLLGSSAGTAGTNSVFNQLFGDGSNLLSAAFDYRQTGYSKELSRLEEMSSKVADLSSTAKSLQSLTASTDTADIKSALQKFVQQYNAWDAEFDGDVAKGGMLEGSQAANMARFSMQRDVTDIFNGHGNGGLGTACRNWVSTSARTVRSRSTPRSSIKRWRRTKRLRSRPLPTWLMSRHEMRIPSIPKEACFRIGWDAWKTH